MRRLDSITRAKMKLTVEVNRLHLPVPAVPESLQRFCRPLAFYNNGFDQDLSFSGTCLLVRNHGRNLLLCSRHQLTNAQRRPDEIVIVLDGEDGRRVGLNPNEVSQVVLEPSSDPPFPDLGDIMIAEYFPTGRSRDLQPHFLSLDLAAAPDLGSIDPDSVDAIFTIAYPTSDTEYESNFDDNWNLVGVDIVSRWWKLYFQRTTQSPWDCTGLIPLVPAEAADPILEDPDGISGAPVFLIHGIKAAAPTLGFAGIIVRANKQGRVNIVEAAHIRQALQKHIDQGRGA